MSHIVTIQTQVKDPLAITAACQRQKLPPPIEGEHQLFINRATGLAVELPGWRYPVVCEATSGALRYDNFEGRWGDQQHLDKFLQLYAIEKTRLESRRQGHSVTEQQLPDGSVKLTIQVGSSV